MKKKNYIYIFLRFFNEVVTVFSPAGLYLYKYKRVTTSLKNVTKINKISNVS